MTHRHGDNIKGDDEHSGSACYMRKVSYVPTASYQINEEIPAVPISGRMHAYGTLAYFTHRAHK